MSNREIDILREVVIKITRLLSGQSIQVTQCGAQAYVRTDHTGKPVVVNIPFIPNDASSGFLAAVQGFIDHEVGHVLFTDWSVQSKIRNKNLHSCWNQFEDPFVERKMTERFPGTAHNLDRVGEYFIEHLTKPALKACKTEDDVFNVVSICVIRGKSGQLVFDRWCKAEGIYDLPKVKGFLDALGPADLAAMPKIASTTDSLRYARKLFNYVFPPKPIEEEKPEDEQAPPPPPPAPSAPPPPAGDDDEEAESDPSAPPAAAPPSDTEAGDDESETTEESDDAGPEKGEGEADPEASNAEVESDPSLPAEKPEKGEEVEGADESEGDEVGLDDADDEDGPGESDNERDEPEAGESEDESSAAGDDGDDDDELDEEAPDDAAAAGGEDQGEGEEDGDSGETGGGIGSIDDIPEGQDEGSDKKVRDFMSDLTKHLTDESTVAAAKEPYLVYSKDKDVVETYPVDPKQYKDAWLTKMDEEAGRMVGVMQKDIERMMASRSRVMQVPGFRSGRLHASSLHRLRTGDDRVFGRRHEAKGKQTVVSLLIDNSGSMNGSKMTTAMQSAYAMSLTLERVGIKHEVLGFTTGNGRGFDHDFANAMSAEASRIGRHFSRMDIIHMPVYKHYTERLTPAVKKRFADAMVRQARMEGNIDGEAVDVAARRLRAEKADRHVLIVFSDGNPAGSGNTAGLEAHLKDTVKAVTASGVDVFGIGIEDKSVKRFYPHHVVINSSAELPKVVMGHIKTVLSAA